MRQLVFYSCLNFVYMHFSQQATPRTQLLPRRRIRKVLQLYADIPNKNLQASYSFFIKK